MKNVSVNFGCCSFDNIRHVEILFGGRNSIASHKNSAPPSTQKFGEASSSPPLRYALSRKKPWSTINISYPDGGVLWKTCSWKFRRLYRKTTVREPLCRPEAWNCIKKESLGQIFFYRTPPVAASAYHICTSFNSHAKLTSCTMLICNLCIIFKTKLNIIDIFVEIVVFVLFIRKGQLIGVFENLFVCFWYCVPVWPCLQYFWGDSPLFWNVLVFLWGTLLSLRTLKNILGHGLSVIDINKKA